MAKKSIEEQKKELELQLKKLEIAQLQEELNQARKPHSPKKIEEGGSIIYMLRNILVVITQSIMWVGETFGKSLERFEERLNGEKGDDTQQPLDEDKEE